MILFWYLAWCLHLAGKNGFILSLTTNKNCTVEKVGIKHYHQTSWKCIFFHFRVSMVIQTKNKMTLALLWERIMARVHWHFKEYHHDFYLLGFWCQIWAKSSCDPYSSASGIIPWGILYVQSKTYRMRWSAHANSKQQRQNRQKLNAIQIHTRKRITVKWNRIWAHPNLFWWWLLIRLLLFAILVMLKKQTFIFSYSTAILIAF